MKITYEGDKVYPSDRPNQTGISMRDYIAIEAMKGLIFRGFKTLNELCERSYKIADGMMEQREKRP